MIRCVLYNDIKKIRWVKFNAMDLKLDFKEWFDSQEKKSSI